MHLEVSLSVPPLTQVQPFEEMSVFIILWKCSYPLQISLHGHAKCVPHMLYTKNSRKYSIIFPNGKEVFASDDFNPLFFSYFDIFTNY